MGLPLRVRFALCAYRRWMTAEGGWGLADCSPAARGQRRGRGEGRGEQLIHSEYLPPPRNPSTMPRNGRDHAAPSDDKNAIIMAPEWFLLHRSKYPLRPSTWQLAGHLPFIEKFVSFISRTEKSTCRKGWNPVVSFQTLDKYRSVSFSVKKFSEAAFVSIQRMLAFY